MFTVLLQSVVVRWLTRRVLELGPLASGALSWWNTLSPGDQATLISVLQGNWGLVSLGALVSIAGYVWSFVSTVTPHATDKGVQVPKSQMTPAKQDAVKEAVVTTAARKRPTLLDRIFKR